MSRNILFETDGLHEGTLGQYAIVVAAVGAAGVTYAAANNIAIPELAPAKETYEIHKHNVQELQAANEHLQISIDNQTDSASRAQLEEVFTRNQHQITLEKAAYPADYHPVGADVLSTGSALIVGALVFAGLGKVYGRHAKPYYDRQQASQSTKI